MSRLHLAHRARPSLTRNLGLSASSTASIYHDLQAASEQIRLVIIRAGEPDSIIHADLITVSLQQPQSLSYEALSYAWGSVLETKRIILEGHPFEITANLEAALRRYRFRRRDRLLWVDAICINQEDVAERNAQVVRMGQIFSNCSCGLVWLGDEDDETQTAIQQLGWLAEDRHLFDWDCFKSLSAEDRLDAYRFETAQKTVGDWLRPLRNFMARPWWFRSWTLQECILPRLIEYRCGRHVFIADFITRAVLNESRHCRSDCCREFYRLLNDANRDLFVDGLGIVWDIDASRQNYSTQRGRFVDLLADSHQRQSTLLHDRVYAFLGLHPDSKMLKVDYDLSVTEVFTLPVLASIRDSRSLYVLCFNLARNHGLGLPSWVPDWSCEEELWIYQRLRIDALMSDATAVRLPWIGISHHKRVLGVTGLRLDAVKWTGAAFDGKTIGINHLSKVVRQWKDGAIEASSSTPHHDACYKIARAIFHGGISFDDLEKGVSVMEGLGAWLEDPDKVLFVHSSDCTNLLISIVMRKFFVTCRAELGLGPVSMLPGDEIWMLGGSSVPMVLRRTTVRYDTASTPHQPTHTLVGACWARPRSCAQKYDCLRK